MTIRPTFGKPWTIEQPELSVTTLEEQPVGTVLINLLATDPDSDIAYYEINPPSPYFEVGPKSGVVTIKRVIDYETIVRESPLELDLRNAQTAKPASVQCHCLRFGNSSTLCHGNHSCKRG